MRLYFCLSVILSLFTLSSCRKTKLDDDKSILAGEWQWVYTEEYVQPNAFMPSNLESVIYADSFPKSFALKFMTKGKMERIQDDDVIKDRIVVKSFEKISPTYYSIIVYGDNKEKNKLTMNLLDRATDTLVVVEFPFDGISDANGRVYTHRNVYIRR
jgi:hypothetical protein